MNPKHSILFWKMDDSYLPFMENHDGTLGFGSPVRGREHLADTVKQRLIPSAVVLEWRTNLERDGFRVVTDPLSGHIAAFGKHDKRRTVQELAKSIGDALPDEAQS